MEKLFTDLPSEYERIDAEELYHMFFGNYYYLDIVDTGLTDCYSEEYAMKAQEKAELMNLTLDYVEDPENPAFVLGFPGFWYLL